MIEGFKLEWIKDKSKLDLDEISNNLSRLIYGNNGSILLGLSRHKRIGHITHLYNYALFNLRLDPRDLEHFFK